MPIRRIDAAGRADPDLAQLDAAPVTGVGVGEHDDGALGHPTLSLAPGVMLGSVPFWMPSLATLPVPVPLSLKQARVVS